MVDYDRIESRLKETGVTKAFICNQVGRNRTWLNNAKIRNFDIPHRELEIIANALSTTAEYLRGETDCPTLHQDAKKQPIATLEGLDEELVSILLQLTTNERRIVRGFVLGLVASRPTKPSRRSKERK